MHTVTPLKLWVNTAPPPHKKRATLGVPPPPNLLTPPQEANHNAESCAPPHRKNRNNKTQNRSLYFSAHFAVRIQSNSNFRRASFKWQGNKSWLQVSYLQTLQLSCKLHLVQNSQFLEQNMSQEKCLDSGTSFCNWCTLWLRPAYHCKSFPQFFHSVQRKDNGKRRTEMTSLHCQKQTQSQKLTKLNATCKGFR